MKSVGQYRIIEKIGEGGMASVFKGLQPSLNRSVAIKFLSPRFFQDSTIVERFNRESLIIARLSHPNIIHVIDRGIADRGAPYFVMDFVEGTHLGKLMKEVGFDLNRKLEIVIQVCKALSYAHRNGVIHRDIKPANILIDPDGNAVVTDFGIAQFYEEGKEADELTRDGIVMGTLAYMSPEQKSGSRNVTAASDLYSLGVMIYELFAGKKPEGRFKPPSEHDAGVPAVIDEVVSKCLEADPNDRYKSADEVKDPLLKLLQGAHLRETQKERAIESVSKKEDRFVLLDVIKETKYGGVYLFQDKTDQQFMVVKKRKGGGERALYKKIMTTLKHPNIVKIYGVSDKGASLNSVMEDVSGGSLKERIVQKQSLQETLRIIKAIADALNFAHRNQIVHGNLRPSNILIDESGRVKLSDFGLEEHYAVPGNESNWYGLPGEKRTVPADIYAVGAILYEMMTGSPPLWKDGKPIPHEAFGRLPGDLWKMVSTMLSRRRETRYRSLDEVIHAIDLLLLEGEKADRNGVWNRLKNYLKGKFILYPLIVSFLLAGGYLVRKFK